MSNRSGKPLVFDVGANIGAKAARQLTRGAARVVCFEPVPECVEALQARFGDDPRVTIVPSALGARSEMLPISVCSEATTISPPDRTLSIAESGIGTSTVIPR